MKKAFLHMISAAMFLAVTAVETGAAFARQGNVADSGITKDESDSTSGDRLGEKRVYVQSIAALRGRIMDRNNRPIVGNRPSFNVVWTKGAASNRSEVAKNLAVILKKDVVEIERKLKGTADKPRFMPVCIAKDIDRETMVAIEKRLPDLAGVRIEETTTRDYLHGNMASHVLGYLQEIDQAELKTLEDKNYQPGDMIGKTGVEKVFDESLRGRDGKRYVEVDANGIEKRELNIEPPIPGHDLRLTIDMDLQQAAEKAMEGKSGSIVVMEVNTGRVLVLISSPVLKLGKLARGLSSDERQDLENDSLRPLLNKAVQVVYPPGSTYKIVTALAGLEEGVVNEETPMLCSGNYKLGNRNYACRKKEGHGSVNLHRALAESCDIYFCQLGQKLGVDKLASYASRLGLGVATGIDLENERPGIVPTQEWKLARYKVEWQENETLYTAIGQGFNLATPLQICRMMATVANGGTLFRPQLAETIVNEAGVPIKSFSPIELGKIHGKSSNLQSIVTALASAVNDVHGKAASAKLQEIPVGGIAGTGQVTKSLMYQIETTDIELELPYNQRDHAWFAGFAPADKPQIAVTVLVEHGGHGEAAAAPIAKAILGEYFGLRSSESKGR